ncbi:MAG TPA: isocitrate/isopropylmalate family dehydrogenase [Candidatus Paceibacterota bacterium]
MTRIITVLPGDGIGPEVVGATMRVLHALNVGLQFEVHELGEKTGGTLPASVLESMKRNKVALKGPTGTPLGEGHKSLNVRLRQELNLYANVRPLVSMPYIGTRYGQDLDLVIIRENVEGEYAATEEVLGGQVRVTYDITQRGCDRIAEFAFRYAEHTGRRRVCVVHKANILKVSHGMFRAAAYAAAKRHPNIECRDLIVDNYGMQLMRDASQFDVMLHTNMFGDIFSDVCAGIVHGSLGFAPGANIGDEYAVFEAVHGTAPDIAGKGVANPAAMMLSAAMMLDHINMRDDAQRIRSGINLALGDGWFAKGVNQTTSVSTNEWTRAVIEGVQDVSRT